VARDGASLTAESGIRAAEPAALAAVAGFTDLADLERRPLSDLPAD
jgi:hypothetical protein